MRILIATGLFPPEAGGPATYSKLLLEELPKRGVLVDVLPFRSVKKWPYAVKHLVYFFKLVAIGRRADIIFAQDPVSVGLPALLAAKVLRKRFFLRVGGDYAWEQGVQRFGVRESLDDFVARKNDEYLVPVLILKKLQKMVSLRAEKVIVPSIYLKGVVQNWGVPEKQIIVIHSVVESIPFQGNKEDFRKMLKFEGKMIVSAGRLVAWKGFEALIELVPKLILKYPSFKLVIVGDGPLLEKFDRMTEKGDLRTHVVLTKSLDRNVLFKYIRMADVFVLNTKYEGFSHQLLEVMNIGIPVITTSVGGNPELIRDGKNGLLVKFDNKEELYSSICRVLDDENLSQRLVRNAKDSLRSYSAESMLQQLLKTFGI